MNGPRLRETGADFFLYARPISKSAENQEDGHQIWVDQPDRLEIDFNM